jgi:hypothetical protein
MKKFRKWVIIMENNALLSKIIAIQNSGKSLVKILGILLLNPITIGFAMFFLIEIWGGSWLYMWLPTLVILGITYFIVANLVVGVIVQSRSIKLYNKMSDSYEKEIAYKKIKSSD